MAAAIQLIVGLGNPGPKYAETRHNAGFLFLDALASRAHLNFSSAGRFGGETAEGDVHGHRVRLLKPGQFMNRSGLPVASMARYYQIDPPSILVVHDELDLPPGTVRLKQGGGHGGHNGLRDILAHLGSPDFLRLRVGIGHPGSAREVTNFVLNRPTRDEQGLLDGAIDTALDVMPDVVAGELQKAMHRLHSH